MVDGGMGESRDLCTMAQGRPIKLTAAPARAWELNWCEIGQEHQQFAGVSRPMISGALYYRH